MKKSLSSFLLTTEKKEKKSLWVHIALVYFLMRKICRMKYHGLTGSGTHHDKSVVMIH